MKDKLKIDIFKTELLYIITSLIFVIVHNLNIDDRYSLWIIPMIIIIFSHIYTIKKNNLDINKKAYIFLIPILLILFSIVIVNLDFSNYTVFIILPILVSIFYFSLTNPNYKLSIRGLKWFFKLVPGEAITDLSYIKLPSKSNSDNASNIAKGCIIGIPIAVIILVLLTSADHYFAVFIEKIFNNLEKVLNIDFLIYDVAYPFMMIFALLFITGLNIIRHKDDKLKDIKISDINKVMASTILIIINFIFVLFLISQLSKMTTNFLNLPNEYTYAGYAREGFFQLLLVTSINFGIIVYFIYNTNIIKEEKSIKNMLLLLILFSVILMFDSYYRMILYISAYGFTILRLQVMLFLAMEFIIFMILVKKIISNIKGNESLIFTIIILTTYILNLYLCTDNFINFIR